MWNAENKMRNGICGMHVIGRRAVSRVVNKMRKSRAEIVNTTYI